MNTTDYYIRGTAAAAIEERLLLRLKMGSHNHYPIFTMNMKYCLLLISTSILFTSAVLAQDTEIPPLTELPVLEDGSMLIEDFSGEIPGTLPSRWMNQRAEAIPANYEEAERNRYHYEVIKEGSNHFLRFDGIRGAHLNFPIGEVENYNINDFPKLSWKWRAHTLPVGGNENSGSSNDVTSSIYVVYSVNWLGIPKVIRYTWSSTLPKGTELSKNFGHQKIVVVETGKENIGEWITFERDINEDYRRLHGGNPPSKPLAILILSDGVSTGTPAKADYDMIRFLPVSE